MNKSAKAFIKKFIETDMKPSDFRFKWEIIRCYSTNWNNVRRDAKKLGLIAGMDLHQEANTLVQLIKKNFSSKHYIYCLVRVFPYNDLLCQTLADLTLNDKSKMQAICKGKSWASYKEAITIERTKNRTFSSLSNMQKWVDKNGLEIDVYELWKKSSKVNKIHIRV